MEKKVKDFLVSKTDTKGKITYCNKAFIEISGFSENELLNKPHSIVRHEDMPRTIFKLLWDTLKSNNELNAFVKNRAKDGGYYWVFANVTPSFDIHNNVVGFYSVRRKPNEEALKVIAELYANLKEAEAKGGLEGGLEYFNKTFKQKSLYNNFVLELQLGGGTCLF